MKRSFVVLAVTALLCLSACVSIVGGPGGISPSQFEFLPIVPVRAPGPGGWKSARVVIHLLHVTEQGIRKNVFCPIEVQVPEVNYLGVVTDQFAQWEAARAADIAAERTLKHQELLSAELCQRFMAEMLEVLGEAVDGARVIKAL
ncbi:MAG TPA: hypothetical protein VFZ09_23850 [Archangium sp.]|uniref:hypothetical protein n=1 Tax=Archangium sp. TaxID=1872627 RepID=UPI002E34A74B|nr:hypothetical protein [Archangium sp.]HEX5749284.1 hypothetical protein [Archangium sp.]